MCSLQQPQQIIYTYIHHCFPPNPPQGYVRTCTHHPWRSRARIPTPGRVRAPSTFSWSSTSAVGLKSNSASALWTGMASRVRPRFYTVYVYAAKQITCTTQSASCAISTCTVYTIQYSLDYIVVSVLFRMYIPAVKPPMLTQYVLCRLHSTLLRSACTKEETTSIACTRIHYILQATKAGRVRT